MVASTAAAVAAAFHFTYFIYMPPLFTPSFEFQIFDSVSGFGFSLEPFHWHFFWRYLALVFALVLYSFSRTLSHSRTHSPFPHFLSCLLAGLFSVRLILSSIILVIDLFACVLGCVDGGRGLEVAAVAMVLSPCNVNGSIFFLSFVVFFVLERNRTAYT